MTPILSSWLFERFQLQNVCPSAPKLDRYAPLSALALRRSRASFLASTTSDGDKVKLDWISHWHRAVAAASCTRFASPGWPAGSDR
jgi:hypothetical protein